MCVEVSVHPHCDSMSRHHGLEERGKRRSCWTMILLHGVVFFHLSAQYMVPKHKC